MSKEDFNSALRDTTGRLEELRNILLKDYPVLRGTLAIPGAFIGYGLGSLVANKMSDEQIVSHVLGIIEQIRGVLASKIKRN